MKHLNGLLSWGMVFLWAGAIFVFSSMSDPLGLLSSFGLREQIGRVAHLAEYAGLTVLVFFALSVGKARMERWTGLTGLAVVLAMALLDEMRQSLIPGRDFEFFDIGLDFTGALVGLVIIRIARLGGSLKYKIQPADFVQGLPAAGAAGRTGQQAG